MRYLRPNVSEGDTGVLAAWGEQVAMASRMPSLSRLFVQCGDELFPRFAASYEELRTLPRRTRRALQRRLARSRDLTRLAKDGMPAHGGRALRHKLAWSLAGAALLLALWQNADAAIITVNTTKPNTVLNDGKCSLIEAIIAANTDANFDACVSGDPGADTIILPKGNHVLTQVNNGANGLPVITTPITIEGPATISRKKGPTQFRLFEITTGTLTLNNVKLSGGASPLGGGAVFNNGGTLTITNSAITGNLAAYGGGIHNSDGSVFTLTDSSVSGNKAVNNADEGIGGGISNHGTLTVESSLIAKNVANSPTHGGYGGGIANYGTATVSNSLVSGNTASTATDDAAGGGIHNCGDLTVENSDITKNTAKAVASNPYHNSYGGGLNNGGGPSPGGCSGTASLSQSTISLNKAEFGAGVYNASGTVSMENSTVSGNKANFLGGGIFNNGTMIVSNVTIAKNTANIGGGLHNSANPPPLLDGTVNMENSTVSGNKATFWGGGIFNDGIVTVSNVTITKNTGKFGGGLYNSSGTTTLHRTLISGNKAPSGAGPEVYNHTGSVVANSFNLFGQKNNPGVANVSPGATDVIPALNVTTPKIVSPALKNNGGPTPTHALVLGSPALDRIAAGAPATDQRGVTRPQNGLSDIGAFELAVGP